MSMTADQIVDRRRLRRKLTFWRVVGFLAVARHHRRRDRLFRRQRRLPADHRPPQIARITVSGFITDDQRAVELLDQLAKTTRSRA